MQVNGWGESERRESTHTHTKKEAASPRLGNAVILKQCSHVVNAIRRIMHR